MSYLGIDLGTSGLRALLVDGAGRPIGSVERTYTVTNPHPGWAEQNPHDWIAALDDAADELRVAYPAFADLKGIGIAGHMHGAVCLDADDRVLTPCILWNDSRSADEAAMMDADPKFRKISGNIVFPGFTAPKLAWLRRHAPEVFARIAKVLLPAGYLNLYLTGDHVADMSDSAGTAWLDVARREWSTDLLAAGGMRTDQMPRLVEGAAKAGTLRAELSRRWGVRSDVTIAGGAGDNAASACGMGALGEGQGFVSLGTSGVLLIARNRLQAAPESALHSFCHAVPDRWVQMGVMLSAADSLSWLGKVTQTSPPALTGALGAKLRPPGAVGFLPYLSGERTPHNDARIRGGFTGLSTATTQTDLTQAVLEGVCFGLRDSARALANTGGHIDRLFAIGGGAASKYWLRMLATVLNAPLHLPDGREFGAALGAARLGMVAATGSAPSDVMRPPASAAIIEPQSDLTDAYSAAYDRFRASYPAFKSIPEQGAR